MENGQVFGIRIGRQQTTLVKSSVVDSRCCTEFLFANTDLVAIGGLKYFKQLVDSGLNNLVMMKIVEN